MNEKLHILNLEDDVYDAELVHSRLAAEGIQCEVSRVYRKEDYIRALEEGEFDLILADYSLPDFDGLEALAMAIAKRPETPFIFVSGVIGEDFAIETLKKGATDYVLKNRLQRLVPAVRRAVLEAAERAEHRQAEKELRKAHIELERRVEERTAELTRLTASLKEEINRRNYMDEQIKRSLQEKEILLKELHHRTKNNMYVISSLVDLQSAHIQDEALRSIFRDIKNRIQSMALVHEKLYKSKSLSRLKVREYIKDLSSAIMKTYKGMAERVRIELDVEDMDLDIDTAVPAGLALNELISNSLQHAFPGQQPGKISIRLYGTGGMLHLRYSDNGIGFPPDFDISKTSSLGLKLVYNIIYKQLNGKIETRLDRSEFEITLQHA